MINRVCFYCASSSKLAPHYYATAAEAGRLMAADKVSIVYGGGSSGLMGALADAAMEAGGEVIGVIPKFMTEVEWQHNGISELIIVETMHERKALFLEDIDAVVAMPGGCGTFEELLEVITLKQLGQFTKPIIILNTDGYYNPLIELFEKAIDQRFMPTHSRNMWVLVDHPSQILEAIQSAPVWDADMLLQAKI